MDFRGFLVRVSDGEINRHTVMLATDLELARLKALFQFRGTRWLVQAVVEIAR